MHQQEPFYPDEEWEYYEGEYQEEYSYPPQYAYEEEDDYEYSYAYYGEDVPASIYPIPNMGILIGVAIVLFFILVALKNGFSTTLPDALASSTNGIAASTLALSFPTAIPSGDPLAFAPPYTDYTITQGLHGQSYGHLAIDLAAGRGSPVLSPINGVVTGNGTDQYGNTTITIENEVYRVLILHGDFSTQVGTEVHLGDQIGTESNHGYTMDMAGNLCYGREWCGNHTHLNVFDKRVGTNVSPLELINP
ncbi:MAG TPA: M23 family metallopeptidase [Anaerolineales bacterium]|nr:M23 family metallopeptidase [Anaerolineales bacterium]